MKLLRRACVVGADGAFGRILCKKLYSRGMAVIGTDIKAPASRRSDASFIKGDFGEILRTSRHRLAKCDLLIFCTPEEVVIKHLAATLKLTGLRVCSDICSVKSRIQRVVSNLRSPQQRSVAYVGIHPMFGPTEDFSGYNLCIVPMQRHRGRYAAEFQKLIRTWSAEVTVLSPKEHDVITAWSQAATHLSILSYASAVTDSGISLKRIMRTATPNQQILLSLGSRIAGGEETNWQIQHENPFAGVVRDQLIQNLKLYVNMISTGNRSDFLAALSAIDKCLPEKQTGLRSLSAKLVEKVRLH